MLRVGCLYVEMRWYILRSSFVTWRYSLLLICAKNILTSGAIKTSSCMRFFLEGFLLLTPRILARPFEDLGRQSLAFYDNVILLMV